MTRQSTQNGKDLMNPPFHAKSEDITTSLDRWYPSPRDAAKFFLKWCREVWTIPNNKEQRLDWRRHFIHHHAANSPGSPDGGGLRDSPFAPSQDKLRFACFLSVAIAASVFKVRLPGIEATMSANFVFILVGILDLSFPETVLMGCLGGLAQSFWHSKRRGRGQSRFFSILRISRSRSAPPALYFTAPLPTSMGFAGPCYWLRLPPPISR